MAGIATLPDAAAAEADGLELRIAAHGAVLSVALANRTAGTLQAYFAAEGPTGRQHDFLTVSLGDGRATRLLHFAGERNSWTVGLVELKAGEEVVDAIDLLAWAADPVNDAEPLARGEYALTATYRVAQPEAWSGSITAGPIRVVVA